MLHGIDIPCMALICHDMMLVSLFCLNGTSITMIWLMYQPHVVLIRSVKDFLGKLFFGLLSFIPH